MSSKKDEKKQTMPIRIESEVYEWVNALKEAYGSKNVSDAIREIVLRAHPDIEAYMGVLEEQDAERSEAQRKLLLKDKS